MDCYQQAKQSKMQAKNWKYQKQTSTKVGKFTKRQGM